MNWANLLGIAHKIGWGPERFWAATMYEFTTACIAHIEMVNPRKAEMSDDDVMAFFRAQPGHRKERAD